MRLNALISASLALALLSSGHSLQATSRTAHRTAAYKAPSLSTKGSMTKRQTKSVSHATKHASTVRGKRHAQAAAAVATVERASASSRSRRRGSGGKSRRIATAQRETENTQLAAARASDLAGVSSPDTPSPASVTRATSVNPRLDSVEQEATNPVILPALYNKRGRLMMPAPLRGSHEILVRQNVVADRDGLDRIQDDADLASMREAHLLVPIPVSSMLDVDERLPVNRRFARPWTAQFLVTLSRAHYARFHTPLQVNSAVRTVEFQQKLQRTNGNAAPAEGETASPHLTGQAVDIAKHGLSMTEIAWLRGYLLPLSQQGRIDVEEEFQQACFHISVYKKYLPNVPKREIAMAQHGGTTALAAGLR